MAILIAIGAISEVAMTDKEYIELQPKNHSTNKRPGLSDFAKFLITHIVVGIILLCGTLKNGHKKIDNGQLTETAHDYAVSCIKQN